MSLSSLIIKELKEQAEAHAPIDVVEVHELGQSSPKRR
jgi:hypothetical protein